MAVSFYGEMEGGRARKQKKSRYNGEVSLSGNMVIGLFGFYICPWVFFWGFL